MSRRQERRPLLRVQANQIFEILEALELDPKDFTWSEEPTWSDRSGDIVPVLTHTPSGSWLRFGFHDGARVAFWNPPLGTGAVGSERLRHWEQVVQACIQWARTIKADLDAPDLWAEIINAQGVSAGSNDVAENRPFTQDEIQQLGQQLDELREYVLTTYATSLQARRDITVRFEYLAGAPKRGVHRIDWLNIFVAQILNMITTGLIPATAYQNVMSMAHQYFAPIFSQVAGWLR